MEGNIQNEQKILNNQLEINIKESSFDGKIQMKDNENKIDEKESPDDALNEKEQNEKNENKDTYDINKDYNFITVLQFVNLFHKVLGISPISTTDLEFSLEHTNIDPLCCKILSYINDRNLYERKPNIFKTI